MSVAALRSAQLGPRTKRGLVLLGGAVFLLAVLAMAIGTGAVRINLGSSPHLSLGQPQKSLLDMLQARSPGARTAAELTKTKVKRPLAKAAPHERALAKVVHPSLPKPFIQALVPPPPELPPSGPLFANTISSPELPQLAQSNGPPPVVPPLIPGGGGPGFPNTPGTPGSPQPPPTPAVPEPVTWASLLLGFAILGLKLRRQRDLAAIAV